ncbi:MAG: Gx transporter family protein [Proteobacteria bacterium]|nr:Gx transporter family protein [Pseudomonadota bacterium]
MTMETKTNAVQPDHKICKIALLVALACVLQISESLIPHPIPGLRLGLANILTLTALIDLGFSYALEVAILRTVLSSLIMGTFMSPTFIMSLGGAVVSTLVMGLFYWLSGLGSYLRMSIIGLSIIGAFVHNFVQLYLAYLLLVKHAGIFFFFPWLSLGAVATGWVVGVVTGGVCRRLQDNEKGMGAHQPQPMQKAFQLRHYTPGDSWLHRLGAEIKLISLFIMAVSLLFITQADVYGIFFIFICLLLPLSKTPLKFLLSSAKKYRVLIVMSVLLPLFFNSGTHILFSLGMIKITREGIQTGALYGARILLLVLLSAFLIRTTSPEKLVKGMGHLLWPLKLFGISAHRTAMILSLSWTAVPRLWDAARDTAASTNFKKITTLKGLLPLLSNFIATLYLTTEPSHGLWDQTPWAETRDPEQPCVSS